MATMAIPLAKQIDRVPSTSVPLDSSQELRFQNLMEDLVMVDIHQHPMLRRRISGTLTLICGVAITAGATRRLNTADGPPLPRPTCFEG